MRATALATVVLLLVPTLVASGSIEIDLAQTVKQYDTAQEAQLMATLFKAVCADATLEHGGQLVASTSTACVVSFGSTVVTFLFRPEGTSLYCTAVWYTRDGSRVGEMLRKLMDTLGA